MIPHYVITISVMSPGFIRENTGQGALLAIPQTHHTNDHLLGPKVRIVVEWCIFWKKKKKY